jgi:hypothetical protein
MKSKAVLDFWKIFSCINLDAPASPIGEHMPGGVGVWFSELPIFRLLLYIIYLFADSCINRIMESTLIYINYALSICYAV